MTTTSGRARALVAACALACASTASIDAFAQTALDLASARELYKQGKELRAQGDLKGARERFKAAHATAATPITTLEYGRVEMELGHLVEARELFLSVARMKVEPDETEKSQAARAECVELADKVKPRIPSLVVKIQGVPPEGSAAVKIDGQAVPPAAVGAPRAMNPGSHEVSAKAGDGQEVSKLVDLKESETQEVTLAPVWVAPKTPEPSAGGGGGTVTIEHKGTHSLVWVGGAVALVGGIAGGVFAGVAGSKASFLSKNCPNDTCTGVTQQQVTDAQSTGKAMRALSIASFVVAGAGVVLLVVGLSNSGGTVEKRTAAKPRIEPWVSYDSVGVGGTF